MERKSIGSFIAALRRAKGYTQRELADKLGVSDKAVSRWERDETAPDLYLIPVIADIFGVSADELLRGERISSSSVTPEERCGKSCRQVSAILKAARTKFLTKTLICVLIAAIGLLGAMLCNFAFYKSVLGFFVGCIFIAASVIISMAFAISAFSALDTEEFSGEELMLTKRYIIKKTETVIFLCLIFFAYLLPMLLAGMDTHVINVRIEFDSWLVFGTVFAAIAAIICAVANVQTDKIAEKRGIYTVDETVAKKRKLAKFRFASPLPQIAKIFLPTIALTIVFNIICLNVFDYRFFLSSKGTVWTDANKLVEYMHTPLDANGEPYDDSYTSFTTHKIWVYDGEKPVEIAFLYKNRYVADYLIGKTMMSDVRSGNGGYMISQFYPDGLYPDGIPKQEYNIPDFYAKTYTPEEKLHAYDRASYVSFAFIALYIAEITALIITYALKVRKKFKEDPCV